MDVGSIFSNETHKMTISESSKFKPSKLENPINSKPIKKMKIESLSRTYLPKHSKVIKHSSDIQFIPVSFENLSINCINQIWLISVVEKIVNESISSCQTIRLRAFIIENFSFLEKIHAPSLFALLTMGSDYSDFDPIQHSQALFKLWKIAMKSDLQGSLLQLTLSSFKTFVQFLIENGNESLIISISGEILTTLRQEGCLNIPLNTLACSFLSLMMQNNPSVSDMVNEEIALSDCENPKKETITRVFEVEIKWTSYIIIRDSSLSLMNLSLEEDKFTLRLLSSLLTPKLSNDILSESQWHVLSSLVIDLLKVIYIPEYITIILLLRQIIQFSLSCLLVKDVKSEIKLKLIDLLSTIFTIIREDELKYQNTSLSEYQLSHCLKVLGTLNNGHSDTLDTPMVVDSFIRVLHLKSNDRPFKSMIEYPSIFINILRLPLISISSDKYIAVLLQSLQEKSPLLRIKSLKGILEIIKVDQNDPLLSNDRFVFSISSLKNDTSPSIRDISLECMIHWNKEPTSPFIDDILSRLKDDSPLVKRRVIRSISDILLNSSILEEDSSKCKAFLIKEASMSGHSTSSLAMKSLVDGWIVPFLMACRIDLDSSIRRSRLSLMASDFIRIMRSFPTNEEFNSFLNSIILDKPFDQEFQEVCVGVIDLLFEALINDIKEDDITSTKFTLAALCSFICLTSITAITSHFRLICQLIDGLKDEIASIYSLRLLKYSLNNDSLIHRSVPSLSSSLLSLTHNGSEEVMSLSIECLFIISKSDHNLGDHLYKTYLKMNNIITNDEDSSQDRALFIASLMVRFGNTYNSSGKANWNAEIEKLILIIIASLSSSKRLVSSSFALKEVLKVTDPFIIIKELSEVLPRLLKNANISTKTVMIDIFSDILEKDSKVDSLEFNSKTEIDTSSMIGLICQANIQSLTDYLEDPSISLKVSKVLYSILNRGFVHPKFIVPSLVGSWFLRVMDFTTTDFLDSIGSDTLLSNESIVLTTLSQLVDFTFRQSKTSIYQDPDSGLFKTLFKPLFDSYKGRIKRSSIIVSLFREVRKAISMNDLLKLTFILETIAYTEFKGTDELFLCLRSLSEIINEFEDPLENEGVNLYCHFTVCSCRAFIVDVYGISSEYISLLLSNEDSNRKTRLNSRRPDITFNARRDISFYSDENIDKMKSKIETYLTKFEKGSLLKKHIKKSSNTPKRKESSSAKVSYSDEGHDDFYSGSSDEEEDIY